VRVCVRVSARYRSCVGELGSALLLFVLLLLLVPVSVVLSVLLCFFFGLVVLFLSVVVVVVALSVGRCCFCCSVVVAVGRLGCTPGLQAIPMSMVILGVRACVRLMRRRQGSYSERLGFPCPFLSVLANKLLVHYCSFECLAMGRQDRVLIGACALVIECP